MQQTTPSHTQPRWVIRPQVPEPVYTDRQEFLDYFYHAALETAARRTMSTVLLGQRRMGKTEIFMRVVNRLFWEQDYEDPQAVVPVYYSFKDESLDRWSFAIDYVENFLRWYAAFRLRDPRVLTTDFVNRSELPGFIDKRLDVPMGLSGTLKLIESLQAKAVTIPEMAALTAPRRVSDYDDSSIVMFLDEFQNTRLPQYDFSVVGFMQQAVESNTCPHFVTGSAMSILAAEILGRGSLFGRFRSEPIKPLTEYWGTELARRAAGYYQATLPEPMAPVVAARCGGNPFYITAVVRQAARLGQALHDEDTLNELLAVDLSSGFIWGELNDQVNRWIARLNDYGITKWILYLSVLEEGDRLDLERIQRELWDRDRQDVTLETIRDVIIKLSRGDLLEYRELGGWFRKVNDPILVEFLRVWGRIAVEGQNQERVRDRLIVQYQRRERQIKEHLGYLAEVYMAQVLLNSQDRQLPGHFFHQEEPIAVPRFVYVHVRDRLGAGPEREIDVLGAAGLEKWVCESKWWKGKNVGREVVEIALRKAELVQAELEADVLRVWVFAHDGFTEDAMDLIQKQGVLWSTRADLDALLEHVGLRSLPDL